MARRSPSMSIRLSLAGSATVTITPLVMMVTLSPLACWLFWNFIPCPEGGRRGRGRRRRRVPLGQRGEIERILRQRLLGDLAVVGVDLDLAPRAQTQQSPRQGRVAPGGLVPLHQADLAVGEHLKPVDPLA